MAKDLLYYNTNKPLELIPEYRRPSLVRRLEVTDAKPEKCDDVTRAVIALRKWSAPKKCESTEDRFLFRCYKAMWVRRLDFWEARRVLSILKRAILNPKEGG